MKKFLISLIGALLLATGATAHAANEVKLLEFQSFTSFYKGYWNVGRFEALVANLGYAKSVNIHIKTSAGVWSDFPLAYSRAADAGREVWAAPFDLYTLPTGADPLEFAVSYTVNGQTYWDNNNGANYVLTRDAGIVLYGLNVYNGSYAAQSSFYSGQNTLYGYLAVKNLSPAKQVNIVYSTDGWKTTKTSAATFNPYFYGNTAGYGTNKSPNIYGYEEWDYTLDVGTTSTRVDYAIAYTVNGQTYWDNNFGHNYVTQIVRP